MPGHPASPGAAAKPPFASVDPDRAFLVIWETSQSCALAEAYRETDLFRRLRNPDLLDGRCGRCEYRRICGGSRSRAFGLTGDPLATDPWCAYVPHEDRAVARPAS